MDTAVDNILWLSQELDNKQVLYLVTKGTRREWITLSSTFPGWMMMARSKCLYWTLMGLRELEKPVPKPLRSLSSNSTLMEGELYLRDSLLTVVVVESWRTFPENLYLEV
jgi:hypothetical protein